ncbi:MAG TPA: hypothetical protein VNA30_01190 [Mycobacteriales bacterium]|nr:hypothetical protein [Mycobacteriales bacterium]
MSNNRYQVDVDALVHTARVPVTEQVQEQAEPRLQEPWTWRPNLPADGGAVGDSDGD